MEIQSGKETIMWQHATTLVYIVAHDQASFIRIKRQGNTNTMVLIQAVLCAMVVAVSFCHSVALCPHIGRRCTKYSGSAPTIMPEKKLFRPKTQKQIVQEETYN